MKHALASAGFVLKGDTQDVYFVTRGCAGFVALVEPRMNAVSVTSISWIDALVCFKLGTPRNAGFLLVSLERGLKREPKWNRMCPSHSAHMVVVGTHFTFLLIGLVGNPSHTSNT